MTSSLKMNARRTSAVLAGLAVAATMAGSAVAGTAAAAPAPARAETVATASGDYAAARGTYFSTYRTSTKCLEVADWLWTFDGITDTWCLQGNAMGTAWHVYYEGRL
ncbi:hypothetical protein ACFQS3_01290 [Glycomyces mayteni]|uniref:Secreted protein n=1 Tax=Glycomyces mayteni TaxID=543887 RepID=A0ABW2D2T4_9ACTN|nr:hypothetical protein GCM10025732_45160 [Glycomyces mayteni]